jgi:uncharacterized membrane protein YccC
VFRATEYNPETVMASASSNSLAQFKPEEQLSFWLRESRHIKQGLKTGVAGLITYAIYIHFHFPEGYWAVFTALVVTQANLGASWKAALYRTAGSTAGALAAAALMPLVGTGVVRAGIVLFSLSALFAFLTTLHPSFSAAGFTAALVLLLSSQQGAFHLAWLRVLYTVLGSVVAFLVGVLIWPVRARDGLRTEIAGFLQDAGRLYAAATDPDTRAKCGDREFDDLRTSMVGTWDRLSTALNEARSEPSFSRFNDAEYASAIEELNHIKQRLLALCRDTNLYSHATVVEAMVPELKELTQETVHLFEAMAAGVRDGETSFDTEKIDLAEHALDGRLQQLRDARATSPFSLDKMLPFWSFLFNLKEMAGSLRVVQQHLRKLS